MDAQLDFGFEDELMHEYLFLISPDYQIISDVQSMKRKINAVFPLSKKEMNSVAHITLFELRNPNFTDEELVETAQKAIKNFTNFQVKLGPAEFWKHGTFILKVRHPEMIRQIHAAFLRTGFKIRGKSMTPHVSIIKGLSPGELALVPDDPSIFEYEAEFECRGITIMKRWVRGEKQGTYVLVSRIEF